MKSRQQLRDIYESHKRWLATNGEEGRRVVLLGATLDSAWLKFWDLRDANLAGASLVGAFLSSARLEGAILDSADLTGAILVGPDTRLDSAWMRGADLTSAQLSGARLSRARLDSAKLTGANLAGAKLDGAYLLATDLTDARLEGAHLDSAWFEPLALPEVRSLVTAKGLSTLRYQLSPGWLVELRNAFKAKGLRRQEREVTHALMRARVKDSSGFERMLLTWYDLTTKYGTSLVRPLVLLLCLALVCTFVYLASVLIPQRWSQITLELSARREPLTRHAPLKALGMCFLFSVMSALNYRVGNFDFGTWIRSLSPVEFGLKATGIARTVSGFQSLMSFLLVVVWLLVLFGRPLENF